MKRWIHASDDADKRFINKALSKVRSDARKAMKDWHKYKDVGIDRLLTSMGYKESGRSMTKFYKYISNYYTTSGPNGAYVFIDAYHLIISGYPHYVEVFVASDSEGNDKLTSVKQVENNY